MPSPLEYLLFSFFRHDDYKIPTPDSPFWNISSASVEGKERIYRILYRDPLNSIQMNTEVLLDGSDEYAEMLQPILTILKMILKTPSQFCKEFYQTCIEWIQEDPWFEPFREELLTEIHLSPCIDTYGDV